MLFIVVLILLAFTIYIGMQLPELFEDDGEVATVGVPGAWRVQRNADIPPIPLRAPIDLAEEKQRPGVLTLRERRRARTGRTPAGWKVSRARPIPPVLTFGASETDTGPEADASPAASAAPTLRTEAQAAGATGAPPTDAPPAHTPAAGAVHTARAEGEAVVMRSEATSAPDERKPAPDGPGSAPAETQPTQGPRSAVEPASPAGQARSPGEDAAAAAAGRGTAETRATRTNGAGAARRDAAGAAGDNLKLIRGIGPQNEAKLNAIGVTTFAQIAAWSEKEQAEIGERLAFPGRIEREKWVEQARVLAEGGRTEFARRAARGEVESSR